jgi:hypothetical protein
MRASHMVLLQDWRDAVVREGVREYTTADGRTVQMSLTGTCLRACHTDKAAFCDRCHDYAHVKPSCWSCHVADAPGASSSSHARTLAGSSPDGLGAIPSGAEGSRDSSGGWR